MERFPSEKERAFNNILSILSLVPTGQEVDTLKMVASAYGLGVHNSRSSREFRSGVPTQLVLPTVSRTKSQITKELRTVKKQLSRFNRVLPSSHPLVARRDALLKALTAGQYSFRSYEGSNDNYTPQAWEETETSEEETGGFSPYGSDADDSVNRIGF